MRFCAEPFRHWIADDWAPPALVRAADQEWPDDRWPWWHRYDSGDAVKYGTRDPARLPAPCAELARMLLTLDLERVLGVEGAFPDFALYGAGLHSIPAGGRLGIHRDSDHHPLTGCRRRLSAMLYVNERWQPDWRGELELWNADATECAVRIEPRFNRLVIFECSDLAYHGVPAVCCPVGEQRRSVATFYWSPATDAQAQRPAAEFVK